VDSERLPRKLAAILYADVAGYSRLTGEDEDATHRRLSAYLDLIAAAVEQHRGRIMHYAGDAVLAMFDAVVNALGCATAIQRDLATRNEEVSDDHRLEFRIGVNLGDVIEDRGDIYGDGVNIAARLESLAEPGGICISGTVHDAIGKKLTSAYEYMGEQRVKNIDQPVRAFRVVLGSGAAVRSSEPPQAPLELPDRPSIAVLPFTNMSGDPEQEYFIDGVVEDIITDLSKIEGLFVIARNSTFTYKGKSVNVRDVCAELGVRYALEGGVRRAANRVRITAQLIDGTTGGHVWAERFDRDLDDIFAVQDEVTGSIVSAIAPRLAPTDDAPAPRRDTESLEAYEYFLRGRELGYRDTAQTNAQAREMLEKAIELDPGFSLAVSHLSRNYAVAYANRWDESPERSLEQALALGQRAVELDKNNPHAYFAVGAAAFWSKRLDDARAAAERCIAIDPNFAEGYGILAVALIYMGKPRQAREALDKGMRLDPHYRDIFLHFVGLVHFQLGEYEPSAEAFRRRLVRKPESDISRALLASTYGHLGKLDESRAEWARLLEVNPDYSLEDRRKVLPYRNPDDFEQILEGLRRAGLED